MGRRRGRQIETHGIVLSQNLELALAPLIIVLVPTVIRALRLDVRRVQDTHCAAVKLDITGLSAIGEQAREQVRSDRHADKTKSRTQPVVSVLVHLDR